MNKFPQDVKIAEKLTDGDSEILSNEKFYQKNKLDVSSLFGDKKVKKKKKNYIENNQHPHNRTNSKSSCYENENDYKVHTRVQPSIQSIPKIKSTYPCPFCDYTTIRINVIIYHIRSHKYNQSLIKSPTKIHSKSKKKQNRP